MSLYSASGARPPAPTSLPALAQTAGRPTGALVPASGKLAAPLPVVDPVSLPDDVVSLSSQGIQARAIEPGLSTSDSAQNLIGGIAKNMFGGQASTGTVSYNMAGYQLRASEGGAAGATPREAQLDLNESASFYGIGEIVTREGQRFDFEVAVKYEPEVKKQAASETGEAAPRPPKIEMPDVLVLTGKPLPAITFPGGLQDLFKLLSRELRTNVSDGESSGSLNLRLTRLVDQAALLAPRARAEAPDTSPAERAKAVASAYSGPASGESISA